MEGGKEGKMWDICNSVNNEGRKEGRKEGSKLCNDPGVPTPGETHQGMLTTNTSFEKFIAPSRGPKALSASSFSGQNGTNLTFD